MKLSVSNLGWNVTEDLVISKLLQSFHVSNIDICPGKYFSKIADTKPHEVRAVKAWWADRGFNCVGMQGLLYGTVGLNIFGDDKSRVLMLEHFDSLGMIANELGIRKLTFGSPKNRDRGCLSDSEAEDIALKFFRELGERAKKNGVQICLEPNPVSYSCNFMTDSNSTASVVTALGCDSVLMQFDTGASAMNQEDTEFVITEYCHLIGHIHLSEPKLVALGSGGVDHSHVNSCLLEKLADRVLTVEVLADPLDSNVSLIESSVKVALEHYEIEV